MRPISSSTRSISNSQTPGEAGDFTASFTGKEYFQDLIDQANTVPLVRIFKLYGIRLDDLNKKTVCPFKAHKGGHENTPSFWYYPETNSFYCFGCNIGGKSSHGCEFIAAMEGIGRVKAAYKIIEAFSSEIDSDRILDPQSFSEQLEIMTDFARVVREFRHAHLDEKSQKFIEHLCQVYDQHNLKRKLSNEALRRVVEQIKEKINLYTCQM